MESVEVSVVLATYNGERFVGQQLESIRRQQRPPDELVVGDDGSTDGTMAVVEAFRKSAPFPVTVLRRERVGLAVNFLRTFEESSGTFVAFCDQDDVWVPQKLDVLLAAAHDHRADLVVHGRRTVDENLRPLRSSHQTVRRPTVEDRLQGNLWWPVAGNAILFRRSLFDGCDWEHRPMSPWSTDPMNHDDLVKLLAAVKGRLVRIPDELVHYRQHPDNVAGAMMTMTEAMRQRNDHRARVLHQVDAATAWSRYFPELVGPDRRGQTERYFTDAAARMRERALRLEDSGISPLVGLVASAARGRYSRRATDGLGSKAFLQDLYYFADRRHRSPETTRADDGTAAGPAGR
ncbi:MAG: glycosyltransferase [Acidimicrobiales bacterium]|jgi:glycosyltransferase involved in cell wall biosynthesis